MAQHRTWIGRFAWAIGRNAKPLFFRSLRHLIRTHSASKFAEPRRILVLQLQQLGDSVIFTPTLRAIRRRFPDAQIDMLASPIAAQLYRKSPHLSRIHVATSWSTSAAGTRLWPLRSLLRQIRAQHYDCTITDITQQSFKYGLIAWMTRARMRVGFDMEGKGFLHTCRIPFRENTPWVDVNLDIARELGARDIDRREEIAFSDEDRAHADSLVMEAAATGERGFIVIHPGSNWQSKTWLPERWASVADALVQQSGVRIVFVGAVGEASTVQDVQACMRADSFSAIGLTDIPQLAALLSLARCFVGTDSGPRNIAGAVGTPTVVVMSAQEHTNHWVGARKAETIIRAAAPCTGCYYQFCAHRLCMRALSVDRVLLACSRVLETSANEEVSGGLENLPIPWQLYESVAGRADADCSTLRALAQNGRADADEPPRKAGKTTNIVPNSDLHGFRRGQEDEAPPASLSPP